MARQYQYRVLHKQRIRETAKALVQAYGLQFMSDVLGYKSTWALSLVMRDESNPTGTRRQILEHAGPHATKDDLYRISRALLPKRVKDRMEAEGKGHWLNVRPEPLDDGPEEPEPEEEEELLLKSGDVWQDLDTACSLLLDAVRAARETYPSPELAPPLLLQLGATVEEHRARMFGGR